MALEFLGSNLVGNGLRNDRIGLLDTKSGMVIELTREEAELFIRRVKSSEFDHLLIGGRDD